MKTFISTCYLNLAEERINYKIPMRATNLWITSDSPGEIDLAFDQTYSSVSASTGFNIVAKIDDIYITNKAQPNKHLVLNYSSTVHYNPQYVGPLPPVPPPTFASKLEVVQCTLQSTITTTSSHIFAGIDNLTLDLVCIDRMLSFIVQDSSGNTLGNSSPRLVNYCRLTDFHEDVFARVENNIMPASNIFAVYVRKQ